MKNNIKEKVNKKLEQTKSCFNKHKEAIIIGGIGIFAVGAMYLFKENELIDSDVNNYFLKSENKYLKDSLKEAEKIACKMMSDGFRHGSPVCAQQMAFKGHLKV